MRKVVWQYDIQIVAALLSILLSIAVFFTKPLINPDGVLYLLTAQAYQQQGFVAAMHTYNWPFYSLVIAWMSQLTQLSLLHAAYLLNTFFIALIAGVFITLLKTLQTERAIHWWGALVILIFPALNHQRAVIIRDFGYWLFLLWGFVQLIRYNQKPLWRHVCGWSTSLLLATAFRIEGIVFWVLSPIALFFSLPYALSERIRLFLKMNMVLVMGVLLLFIVMALHPTITHEKLGRLPELLFWLENSFSTSLASLQTKIAIVKQTVLDPHAVDSATTLIIGGTLSVFLWEIINTLHPLNLACVLHATKNDLFTVTRGNKTILYTAILINVVILALFAINRLFLDTRYVLGLCLFLLLWVPCSLHRLYTRWCEIPGPVWRKWVFPIVCLAMFSMAINGVIRFGHSRAYVHEAADWIKENIATTASLYTNNKALAFYVQRPGTDWQADFISGQPFFRLYDNSWKRYDYLAIQIKHQEKAEEETLFKKMRLKPIRVFENKVCDKIVIFKIKQ